MKKLLYLKGLQGSGKSTYARNLLSKGNWVRLSKDDIREMMHNGKWSRNNEKFVVASERLLARFALELGHSVIIDNTGFNEVHERFYRELAKELKATFELKFFDTPLEECVKNDLKRARSVGKDVIIDTYNRYLKPKPKVYEPPEGKESAIQIDVDGCLAFGHFGEHGRRKPYDWDRVGEDDPNPQVVNLVRRYYPMYRVILLSGRDGVCRPQTEQWLEKHKIPYHELYMRAEGDTRKDTIVKKELFDEYIRGNFHIEFVIDDRPSVVRMWHSLGLPVFAVGDQSVDF